MIPTLQDIIDEIEKGPLAAELAGLWSTTFESPRTPKPVLRAELDKPSDQLTKVERDEKDDVLAKASVHDIKTHRAGRLTPDAYHLIYHALLPRAEELKWEAFVPKSIKYAKMSTLGK